MELVGQDLRIANSLGTGSNPNSSAQTGDSSSTRRSSAVSEASSLAEEKQSVSLEEGKVSTGEARNREGLGTKLKRALFNFCDWCKDHPGAVLGTVLFASVIALYFTVNPAAAVGFGVLSLVHFAGMGSVDSHYNIPFEQSTQEETTEFGSQQIAIKEGSCEVVVQKWAIIKEGIRSLEEAQAVTLKADNPWRRERKLQIPASTKSVQYQYTVKNTGETSARIAMKIPLLNQITTPEEN